MSNTRNSATYDGIPRMPAPFRTRDWTPATAGRGGVWPVDVGNTTATWAARTDAEALERFLPVSFELAEPLLVIEAITLEGLPWLAGRGYEMLRSRSPSTLAVRRSTQADSNL